MSILRASGYMQVRFNGDVIIDLEPLPIHKGIAQLIQELSRSTVNPRDFSTLEIKFSKRVIQQDIDPELQSMLEAAGNDVVYVNDSDFVPDTQITWGRWNELMNEPAWTNALKLATARDKSMFAEIEIQSIKVEFLNAYERTEEFDYLWEKLNAL